MSTRHVRLAFFLCILAALGSIAKAAFGAVTVIGTSPTLILTACDMSTASCTSNWVPILALDNINIQCVWTGTPTGNFSFDVSLDQTVATSLPTTFAAGGAASNFDFDANQIGAAFIRVIYTKTGSTGTANCTAYGKKI